MVKKDEMAKATTACYWIIGSDNIIQNPAVAVDLHDATGALIGETYSRNLFSNNPKAEAREIAEHYAKRNGVNHFFVHYDADSTESFAAC